MRGLDAVLSLYHLCRVGNDRRPLIGVRCERCLSCQARKFLTRSGWGKVRLEWASNAGRCGVGKVSAWTVVRYEWLGTSQSVPWRWL